ncbi:hypothetical protein [Cyanothece sp. BG0011]|uniref:hypothetical protein n=1 Tax=Cyanothece sp. BG0011 TaxID=2082950 RepID=UPI000D1F8A47|nr:hypothetical protein [Cyanothece sp. BG0011]
MTKLTRKTITITLTIIGLMTLTTSIKPILAHAGHDHSQPDPKNTQITEENIQSSPTPESKNAQKLENQTINVTLEQTNQFNFIPQTSEIIFLLLVASPVILKMIKQKLL